MRLNKAICILTAAFLLLGLCACQGKPQPAPSPSGAPTAPPATASPEPTAAPTPIPTPEPTEKPFTFTRANFPRLNGSTSTAPLAEAICARLLGEDPENVGDLIQFSRTTNSYYALMDGRADLILAAECNEQVEARREEIHFE